MQIGGGAQIGVTGTPGNNGDFDVDADGNLRYSDDDDYFLIVEADHTHTGRKKNWNFPEIFGGEDALSSGSWT